MRARRGGGSTDEESGMEHASKAPAEPSPLSPALSSPLSPHQAHVGPVHHSRLVAVCDLLARLDVAQRADHHVLVVVCVGGGARARARRGRAAAAQRRVQARPASREHAAACGTTRPASACRHANTHRCARRWGRRRRRSARQRGPGAGSSCPPGRRGRRGRSGSRSAFDGENAGGLRGA